LGPIYAGMMAAEAIYIILLFIPTIVERESENVSYMNALLHCRSMGY